MGRKNFHLQATFLVKTERCSSGYNCTYRTYCNCYWKIKMCVCISRCVCLCVWACLCMCVRVSRCTCVIMCMWVCECVCCVCAPRCVSLRTRWWCATSCCRSCGCHAVTPPCALRLPLKISECPKKLFSNLLCYVCYTQK